MLELLQNFAYTKGFAFSFGNLYDLNQYADEVTEQAANGVYHNGFLVFYDAYQTIGLNETASGHLTRAVPLSVYILSPAKLEETPANRYQSIQAAIEIAVNLVKQLFTGEYYIRQNPADPTSKPVALVSYTLSNIRATPVLTQTDNPLDGVQLTANLVTNPESLC